MPEPKARAGWSVRRPSCSNALVRQRGIYNARSRKSFRKELRNSLTASEAVLWNHLKGSQLGKKFRRQFSVGPYIVDFFCPECRVAVELDGAKHFTEEGAMHDAKRDEYLKEQDIRVLRFENKALYRNLEFVLETIKEALDSTTPPSPFVDGS